MGPRLLTAGGLTGGGSSGAGSATVDLAPFRSAIVAIRWATVGVGISLAFAGAVEPVRASAAAGAVLAVAVYRTIHPVRATTTAALVAQLVPEVAIAVAAVIATGRWDSPLSFSLLVGPIVGGLAAGWLCATAMTTAIVLTVSIAELFTEVTPARTTSQWLVQLVLVSVLAGYARHVLGEKELERDRDRSRIERLADANSLLFNLHRVAQSLPASLDLDDVLDSTMTRLHDHFDADVAAVLLRDETDGRWHAARIEGIRAPQRLTTDELPRSLQRALAVRSAIREDELQRTGGPGLAAALSSGLYAVLMARGSVIGLVALEHGSTRHFGDHDVELLEGIVGSAALAIDNARWFRRLRTIGAEEERGRIARDLHDRTGQSLAYLAVELDRLVKAEHRGQEIGTPLSQLRDEVRSVIGEIRETLYDLRTDVSEDQGLLPTLEQFASRLRERSRLDVRVRGAAIDRLPVPQERELFRIAQEALVNVERHAGADHVTVTWRCDGAAAELVIVDDGAGFPIEGGGRPDSYGIVGMRERAAAIGARLEIESSPEHGTFVRCSVSTAAPHAA